MATTPLTIVADQPGSWFPAQAAAVSPSQPPVIAIDQPATSAANAGAGTAIPSASGVLDWLQQSTVVAGYPVPHWILLASGIGVVMLLGGKAVKGKRR